VNIDVATLAGVVREVFELDVLALKPGNVSTAAPGHGMAAADFITSATAVAPVIVARGLTVGARILAAVEATRAAVGCNTNLGIILLAAPLIQALEHDAAASLRERLGVVLARLDREDARLAYAAIRLAAPGGLGRAAEHDVASAPEVPLLVAMQHARDRDRIARQYATAYEDVFEFGRRRYADYALRWSSERWAMTGCYMAIASAWPDSHVERKCGHGRASDVQRRMQAVAKAFEACENPQAATAMLLRFDGELKREGVNPGTSADLAVASALVHRFETLLCGQPSVPGTAESGGLRRDNPSQQPVGRGESSRGEWGNRARISDHFGENGRSIPMRMIGEMDRLAPDAADSRLEADRL
jgi:triphosphoribosyl-dephospho-CoA synthase